MTFVALVLAGCSKDDSSNPFDGVVIKLETNEKGEVDLRPDGAVVSAEGVEFIAKLALIVWQYLYTRQPLTEGLSH